MDLQKLENYLAQADKQDDAEAYLKTIFATDEYDKIKAAVFNMAWHGELRLDIYVLGLQWAVVMANDKKTPEEIVKAMSEKDFDQEGQS